MTSIVAEVVFIEFEFMAHPLSFISDLSTIQDMTRCGALVADVVDTSRPRLSD
jgi:hypothetical protein